MRSLQHLLEAHGDSKKSSKLSMEATSIDRNDGDEHVADLVHDYVFIQGDAESLTFLGNMLLAFVQDDSSCTLHLHPEGAGNAHFSKDSKLGILIRKRPCVEG